MNCNVLPAPQPCPFDHPTRATPAELAHTATTRHISAPDEYNELRHIIVHFFAPPMSLPGVNGGPATADVFAFLILAQSIVEWDVVFHMPKTLRRWEKRYSTAALGPMAPEKKRRDFDSRHYRRYPNPADIDGFMDIAYHSFHAFRKGLELWRMAMQQRVSTFDLSPRNGGKVSLCFSFDEAVELLQNPTTIAHAGHTRCDEHGMPSWKLHLAVHQKLRWFTESTRTARYNRLFLLIQIEHKTVLMVYNKQQQNLVIFDAQLAIAIPAVDDEDNPENETQSHSAEGNERKEPLATAAAPQRPSQLRELATRTAVPPPEAAAAALTIHDVPRHELNSGMRVAVGCVGEVAMLCRYACSEIYHTFGGDDDVTKVCFDAFVVGKDAELGEESME